MIAIAGKIVAAIGGLSTVVGGIVWLVKFAAQKFMNTPEQKQEGIAQNVQKEQESFEKTGRPS